VSFLLTASGFVSAKTPEAMAVPLVFLPIAIYFSYTFIRSLISREYRKNRVDESIGLTYTKLAAAVVILILLLAISSANIALNNNPPSTKQDNSTPIIIKKK
jgi:hypothetical protein